MALVPAKKKLELPKGTIQLIGMRKVESAEEPDLYQNVIITLDDGEVVDIETRDGWPTEGGAINEATAWIDEHYYEP